MPGEPVVMGSKAQRAVVGTESGRAQPRPHGNLPIQASSFVGRERELDELEGMLASSRLLTLTGPGGCGKTRLALQTASHVADRFEDGVGFAELASLSATDPVAEGVARALGVRWGAGLSPEEALVDFLAPGEMLLLLRAKRMDLFARSQRPATWSNSSSPSQTYSAGPFMYTGLPLPAHSISTIPPSMRT